MSTAEKTGLEICEYISNWMDTKHGIKATPYQIWHSSPSGDLSHVFYLYDQARREMGDAECSCDVADPFPGRLCVKCNKVFTGNAWLQVGE